MAAQAMVMTSERIGAMNRVADIKAALDNIKDQRDEQLDEVTLTIIKALLRRARFEGWTDLELAGYLGYRKRMATGAGDYQQRERIVRVNQAIRTNRWGLKGALETLRRAYYEESYREKEARAARETFGSIPTGKKGGSKKNGRRRKKPLKRRILPDPEAELRAIMKHNEYVRKKGSDLLTKRAFG